LKLNPQVNILVGNNESGKSTILEAINLALTGILNGRYLKNELSPYLFNYQTVLGYVQSLSDADAQAQSPPSIRIEVFFDSSDAARFKGLCRAVCSKHSAFKIISFHDSLPVC